MLIPRFSLRWLLGLITFCAVISLVLAGAVRNQVWAVGVLAALASLGLVAVLYVTAFLAAWLVAQSAVLRRRRRMHGAAASPFADKTKECDAAALEKSSARALRRR